MKFNKLLTELGVSAPEEPNEDDVLISAELHIDNYDAAEKISKPEKARYIIASKKYTFGDLRSESEVLWKLMSKIMDKVWQYIPKNEKPKDIIIYLNGVIEVVPELGSKKGQVFKYSLSNFGFDNQLKTITNEVNKIKTLMN